MLCSGGRSPLPTAPGAARLPATQLVPAPRAPLPSRSDRGWSPTPRPKCGGGGLGSKAAGRALRASPAPAVQRQPGSGRANAASLVPWGSEEESWPRRGSSPESWGRSGCRSAPLPACASRGPKQYRQVSLAGWLLTLFKVMFLFIALEMYLQQKPIILTQLNLSSAARCQGCLLHSLLKRLHPCGLWARKKPAGDAQQV